MRDKQDFSVRIGNAGRASMTHLCRQAPLISVTLWSCSYRLTIKYHYQSLH